MAIEKLNNLARVKRHLVCDEETFELIMRECTKEYLKHHPEMLGCNITQNHILKQIARFYLER